MVCCLGAPGLARCLPCFLSSSPWRCLRPRKQAGGKWWNPGRSPRGTGRRDTPGACHLPQAGLGPSSPSWSTGLESTRSRWSSAGRQRHARERSGVSLSARVPTQATKSGAPSWCEGPKAATRGQRGAARRVGQGVQPQPAMERAAPAARHRTGGSRKARAGRSQTVAECEASPRTPVPQWEAQPRAPSRQARETGSRRSAARPQPATRPAGRGEPVSRAWSRPPERGTEGEGRRYSKAWGASSGPSARPGVQPGSRARCRFKRGSA